jgi:hypothetical protein
VLDPTLSTRAVRAKRNKSNGVVEDGREAQLTGNFFVAYERYQHTLINELHATYRCAGESTLLCGGTIETMT